MSSTSKPSDQQDNGCQSQPNKFDGNGKEDLVDGVENKDEEGKRDTTDADGDKNVEKSMLGGKWIVLSLIRHGQCLNNITRNYPVHDPLTEDGKTQVKNLATSWADVRIDALYTSNLLRAFQTAAILQDQNKSQPKITFRESLCEQEYGAAFLEYTRMGNQDRAHQELASKYMGKPNRTYVPAKDGETLNDVAARAKGLTLEAIKEHGVELPEPPKIVDIIENEPSQESLYVEKSRRCDAGDIPEGIPHVVFVSHNILMTELYEAFLHFVMTGDEHPNDHKWTRYVYSNAGWSRHLLWLGHQEGKECLKVWDMQTPC